MRMARGLEFVPFILFSNGVSMEKISEKLEHAIGILHCIQTDMKLLYTEISQNGSVKGHDFVHMAFKGAEIYLLHKAFIDAGGAPSEIYKTILEKTAPHISNKTQKGFSPESLSKYSDKVDPETKDNVKRFLQRMIRNIDSYD